MRVLTALVLSALLLGGSAAAVVPEEVFPAVNTYPGFIDIEEGAWYADAARVCCEVGLMQGTGQAFAPDQILTIGEVAAIAARMNEALTGDPIISDTARPNETVPWYQRYVDYLEERGISVAAPGAAAARIDFVTLLHAVVPEDMLSPINAVTSLPDTQDAAVLTFYRAGILTGVDPWGTFSAGGSLTRAEAAAMVSRIVRPALRVSFEPAPYHLFLAAGLSPSDVLFSTATQVITAGEYLPYLTELIGELEAACDSAGLEFNWFNTYGEKTFLDYVKASAMEHFGVTRDMGTELYQKLDIQVFYSKLLDLWDGNGLSVANTSNVQT